MKKNIERSGTDTPPNVQGDTLGTLIGEIRVLIQAARHAAASAVNSLQVATNFEIGRRIVEEEQKGADRAEYGTELLKVLSLRLTEEFGRGFSPVNLSLMRRFYLTWKGRANIFQKPSEKSIQGRIDLPGPLNSFSLSWSHYVLLLSIKDPNERSFYEEGAA